MRLCTVLLYFLRTAVHVSDDTLIHHQEHIQTVITSSCTGQTVFATVHWRGGVGTSSVHRESFSIIVQQDATIYSSIIFSADSSTCFGWWMRVSSATRRVVCKKYNKTVNSRISLDNYWQWWNTFVTHTLDIYILKF